jgi:peptidoglycan/LPS O-acetylase OafA/YrhL
LPISEKPKNLRREYYPGLDGLRGIAILLVVFYHNFGFSNYFFFGWLGVDLFFVLSGFLITDLLLKTFHSPNYLKNFYVKRVLRIFPLYYFSLVLFLIILPLIKNFPLDFSYYINNQWWFWAYLQNWLLIFKDTGNATTALQHYWSLAVEEQFYLIWPLVILLFKKPKYLLAFAGVLLLGVIAIRFSLWTMQVKDLNYFGLYTFTRIDGICIGSMLAILQYMRSRFLNRNFTIVVLILAGFNFLFFFFNRQNEFSFPYLAIVGYTTFAVMFALLIHETVQGENKFINSVLDTPVLKFFGRISYGFYIFHWPVYLILYEYLAAWVRNSFSLSVSASQFIISIILTIIGLAVSIMSYYGFERHFLKMKKAFNGLT